MNEFLDDRHKILLNDFRRAWQSGNPPALRGLLDSENAPPDFVSAVVGIDLTHRWQCDDARSQVLDTIDRDNDATDHELRFRPLLEDYLELFPHVQSDNRSFLSLIGIEFQARVRSGEHPTTEEYRKRFKSLAHEIPALLKRASEEQSDDLHQTESFLLSNPQMQTDESKTSNSRELASSRFDVIRRLGGGGMGEVFEAHDRRWNRQVAVKLLPHANSSAVFRFKSEFRSIANLRHPNLIRLYELMNEEDQWFYTMEVIDGCDFRRYVRGDEKHWNSQIESRLRSAFAQLVHGVSALHAAGYLHRDLKPSNVLVTHDDRVVVLDLGLQLATKKQSHDRTIRQGMVGTIAYMSPEQADGQAIPASDWYSIGVMLFECLTGVLPFAGSGIQSLKNRQQSDPPSPDSLVKNLPKDLVKLCHSLLQRNPKDRIDETEILATVGPPPDRQLVANEELQAVDNVTERFVGREVELQSLQEGFEQTKDRRSSNWIIHAPSGFGKSALLDQFLNRINEFEEDVIVLRGRCYERESLPFKALDSVLESLARYLCTLTSNVITGLAPHYVKELMTLFPVFERVDEFGVGLKTEKSIPDPQECRRRGFDALRDLLVRLAEIRRVVICIDDLQWSDVDSGNLIRHLFVEPNAPRLMLIGLCRSEVVQQSHWIEQLIGDGESPTSFSIHELALAGLGSTDLIDLAQSLLQADQVDSAKRIAEESHGSPFFVHELARYASRQSSSDQLLNLDDAISDRVAALPESTKTLLDLIVVAGEPLELESIPRSLTTAEDWQDDLAVLCRERLVRSTGMAVNDVAETSHDRIRECVERRIEQPSKVALHKQLAIAIQASSSAEPQSLARHLEQSEQFEAAILQYAEAGRLAMTQLAFDHAADMYGKCIDLNETNRVTKIDLHIHEAYADALAAAGRGMDAGKQYLNSIKLTDDAQQAFSLTRKAAEQLLTSGQIVDGTTVVRQVLELANIRFVNKRLPLIVGLLISQLRSSRRLRKLKSIDLTHPAQQRINSTDACWAATSGFTVVDPLLGTYYQALGLDHALRAGDRDRLVRALIWEVTCLAVGGTNVPRQRIDRLLGHADRLMRPDDEYGRALRALVIGGTEFMRGAWSKSKELSERAESMLRDQCAGSIWEQTTAQSFSIWASFYLGRIQELRARTPALVEEARVRGNAYAQHNYSAFTRPLICLADDQPDVAMRELLGLDESQISTGVNVQWANRAGSEIDNHLYVGKYEAALSRSLQLEQGLKDAMMSRVQCMMAYTQFQVCRCVIACLVHEKGNPPRLKRIYRSRLRALKRQNATWIEAMAESIEGLFEFHFENQSKAIDRIKRVIMTYHDLDMNLYENAYRFRLGKLMGGDEGAKLVEGSLDWFDAEKVQDPSRLVSVYAPGIAQ